MNDQEKLQAAINHFEEKKTPDFPFMQIQVLPQGVMVTIVYSIFKQEQVLIPQAQAEQLAIQMVLQMSDDNFKQMMQMKKEQVAEKQLISNVIKEKKLHD